MEANIKTWYAQETQALSSSDFDSPSRWVSSLPEYVILNVPEDIYIYILYNTNALSVCLAAHFR